MISREQHTIDQELYTFQSLKDFLDNSLNVPKNLDKFLDLHHDNLEVGDIDEDYMTDTIVDLCLDEHYSVIVKLLAQKNVYSILDTHFVEQTLVHFIAGEQHSLFKQVLQYPHIKLDKDTLIPIAICADIKTRLSDSFVKTSTELLELAENTDLQVSFDKIKRKIIPILSDIQELEKSMSIEKGLFISLGGDLEQMVNIIFEGSFEKNLAVTTSEESFEQYVRHLEEVNNVLVAEDFLPYGTYDSIHFMFGIRKDQEDKIKKIMRPLDELSYLIAQAYNTLDRNEWIKRITHRISLNIGDSRYTPYGSESDSLPKGGIVGSEINDYTGLFQNRWFSLIAGESNYKFLMSIVRLHKSIIDSKHTGQRLLVILEGIKSYVNSVMTKQQKQTDSLFFLEYEKRDEVLKEIYNRINIHS